MRKFLLKVKNGSKNFLFSRSVESGGGFYELYVCEHDKVFKTLLGDMFSSKHTHVITSFELTEKFFFEVLTFFVFLSIFTYNVHFSKVKFANISSGIRDMILEPNTFEKNTCCLIPNNSKWPLSSLPHFKCLTYLIIWVFWVSL